MSQFKTITATAAPGVFSEIAAYDRSRRFMQIQNKGTSAIYLNFGTDTPTELNSMKIPAGGFYEPWVCPTNKLLVSVDSTASTNVPILLITDETATTTVRS